MFCYRKLFICYCFTSLITSSIENSLDNNNTSLELVFVIFRHGERVPETNEQYPADDYKIEDYAPMTYGEITNEGKRRQYRLGEKLRKKYNNFLGPLYRANEVATFSTDWDRTKTSALLLLAGLFPPHPSQIWNEQLKWLPIPFHYKTSDNDHILQRPDPYCPRYVKELKKVMDSQEAKDIRRKYDQYFELVEYNAQRKMFDFHEMFRVYQNLHAKVFLNKTIPNWAKSVYPEPLHTIASYQCVFENFNTKLKRLNGGHILQKFIEIAQQKINKTLVPPERKIYLFSAHENNIVNILAVLGLYQQHLPPYCSAVMLELHRDNATNQFGFKVFYDNSTYADDSNLMTMPQCQPFCPLDKFIDLTKDVVTVNYTAECESDVYLD